MAKTKTKTGTNSNSGGKSISLSIHRQDAFIIGVLICIGVLFVAIGRSSVASDLSYNTDKTRGPTSTTAAGANLGGGASSSTTAAATTAAASDEEGGASSGDSFAIGGGSESLVAERAVADDLTNQLKKAKNAVKENEVAKDLEEQLKKAKKAVKENAFAFPDNGASGAIGASAAPFEKRISIKKNGIGHIRAPVGGVAPRAARAYPAPREKFTYVPVYSHSKTEEADTRPAAAALDPDQRPSQTRAFFGASMGGNRMYDGTKTFADVVEAGERRRASVNNFGLVNSVYKPDQKKFSVDPGFNGYWDYKSPVRENAQANDMGMTGHQFESIPGGFKGDEWERKGANWAKIKRDVLDTVKNITGLFDRLFAEELFPDAVVDKQDNGQVYIRDGKEGKCIRADRYYEYVQASIMAQLALGKVGPLPWARSIQFSFDDIEKNKPILMKALVEDCGKDGKSSFIISKSGEVKTATGEAISVTLPWPKDNSTLYDHPMMFSKSKN